MAEGLAHYFVTDVEIDGPDPAHHSMLSFATVVVRQDGAAVAEFEAVLQPRPERTSDEKTMAWWQSQPEAWAAATENPEPPDLVMKRFADWVETFPGTRAFAAKPLMLDGPWVDRYLRDYADTQLLDIDIWGRQIFTAMPVDLGSFLSGVFNRVAPLGINVPFPDDWLGGHAHSHRAIDDARGYAAVLGRLLKIVGEAGAHPSDFLP